MRQPGLDLPHLFMSVRGDVEDATRHLPHGPQRPEEVSSLTDRHRLTFADPARAAGIKAAPDIGVVDGKGPAAAATTPTVALTSSGKRRALLLDLAPKDVPTTVAQTITGMVVVRLSRSPSLEVVS